MLALVFALLLAVCASEVVELTVDNFEHLTQASTGATTGDWLVKFYAPWCGHCKRLSPVWDEISVELKDELNVAKVDVTANRALGQRFGIRGFPTILFFSKGRMYKYKGKRTIDDFKDFVAGGYTESEYSPAPKEIGMWESLLQFLREFFLKITKDFKKKKYITPEVVILLAPICLVTFSLIVCIVGPSGEKKANKSD
jgi:protein disulfide-isomerase-like protein